MTCFANHCVETLGLAERPLMSPNDCKESSTTDNPLDVKLFKPVCGETHEHPQHIMKKMEENHGEDSRDHHNVPICHDPKIAEFRLCCEHFFRQNSDTTCEMTPIKVQQLHLACQFFQEKKPQGWKRKGVKSVPKTDCAKATEVAKCFNQANCSNRQISKEKKAIFLKLCPSNGAGFMHVNQTRSTLK